VKKKRGGGGPFPEKTRPRDKGKRKGRTANLPRGKKPLARGLKYKPVALGRGVFYGGGGGTFQSIKTGNFISEGKKEAAICGLLGRRKGKKKKGRRLPPTPAIQEL